MAVTLNTREVAHATVVSFPPDTNLDALAVDDVRGDLTTVVEQTRGAVVIDFEHVRFASSPAIGLLVTLRLKAARTNHRLVLAALGENIAGVLDVMQMTQLFELHPDVATALAAVGAE